MLGLTREQVQRIENDFDKVPGKNWREELTPVLTACTPEEKLCMRFLYAYAPVGDIGNVPAQIYLHTVKATLRAKKELPWAEDGTRFFSYVLPLRVNNEALTDHRAQFYEELLPRISGKTRQEAIIETGYWCAEQATYRSTDDRTSSPLGVLRRGFGRCGEESTLAVCALRSIGIAARQVYVPYWAHCDDNHAWVEVWDGENWSFLGGCEPEEALCRGWFTDTATCAMLVRARVFSPFVKEPMESRSAMPLEINTLSRYAHTKHLTVLVTENGMPVAGAEVRFQLINYAALCTLTALPTDETGTVCLETGYGDLYIEISTQRTFCHQVVSAETTDITVELTARPNEYQLEDAEEVCTLAPPELQHLPEQSLSEEQKAAQEQKLRHAAALRAEKTASFYAGEDVLLQKACGNVGQITAFLQETDGNFTQNAEKRAFLQTLREKDLSDVSPEVLQAHFSAAELWKNTVPKELFWLYVACPRIKNEELTAFRQPILAAFSAQEQAAFYAEPTACHRWIEEHITDVSERDFAEVVASPAAVLQTGVGGEQSKKLLCIAMLRTFGIPAMLRTVDDVPLFYRDGWHRADGKKEETGVLRLTFAGEDRPQMGTRLSLARLENDGYHTLAVLPATEWTLPVGKYRLLCCTRGRGGKVYARLYWFALTAGNRTELSPQLPKEPVSPMRPQALAAAYVTGNSTVEIHTLLRGRKTALAILQPGTEPTAHLVSELIACKEKWQGSAENLLLVYRKEEEKNHPMLQALTAQTGLPLWKMDEGEAFRLMQRFGEQVKLPLVLLLDEEVRAVENIQGYHVGTGEILAKYGK